MFYPGHSGWWGIESVSAIATATGTTTSSSLQWRKWWAGQALCAKGACCNVSPFFELRCCIELPACIAREVAYVTRRMNASLFRTKALQLKWKFLCCSFQWKKFPRWIIFVGSNRLQQWMSLINRTENSFERLILVDLHDYENIWTSMKYFRCIVLVDELGFAFLYITGRKRMVRHCSLL